MRTILLQPGRTIERVFRISCASAVPLPLLVSRVPAGFPSPADDYMDRALDLNEHLIQHPSSTYYVRVSGDSMTGAGIYSGDILIVDQSVQARSGNIIIALLHGELTVKRFMKNATGIYLVPENPAYEQIKVTEGMDFEVRGVVMHVIHSFV